MVHAIDVWPDLQRMPGLPSVELGMKLKPEVLAFADEYIRNGGKRSTAWLATLADTYKGKLPEGNLRFGRAASLACTLLKDSRLLMYIHVRKQEVVQAAVYESERSYRSWLYKAMELRDLAATAGQYGAALKGHEMIGKSEGHVDQDRTMGVAAVSDNELLHKLVDVLGDQAGAIKKMMGVSGEVIEGEMCGDV